MAVSSSYTMIDTKRSKSNFIAKQFYVDDLIIARNGIDLQSNAKDLIMGKVAYDPEIKFSRENIQRGYSFSKRE